MVKMCFSTEGIKDISRVVATDQLHFYTTFIMAKRFHIHSVDYLVILYSFRNSYEGLN
ncbi:hypothetical protein E2C01_073437 [Portunus trituberculatus]|uniref:Uncharacterized protein n=1 Tax=Portunus trituberculatus TaxID=210409 RepID=A0A5B7IAJ7_PORTR|nr:hypothetical protein [Portunus trituberculatus]